MSLDYGGKFSKPGYDVKTADPNELVFSSKYKTLRVKAQGNGIITQTGGRQVVIAHNLGYVPYFVAHVTPDIGFALVGGSSAYSIPPYVPVVTGACHMERQVYAYADDINLYIKLGDDFGYNFYSTGLENGDYANQNGGLANGLFWCGYDPGLGWNEDGAIRFPQVIIDKSANVISAQLKIYIGSRDGGDEVKADVYGCDTDNIGSFGNPFSESKTSAHSTTGTTQGAGSIWSITVTDIVNEIINRGGWTSANAMAFLVYNNGTTGDNGVFLTTAQDNGVYCSNSCLQVLKYNNLCNYKYTIYYNKIE